MYFLKGCSFSSIKIGKFLIRNTLANKTDWKCRTIHRTCSRLQSSTEPTGQKLKPKLEQFFKDRDGVIGNYEIIYRAPMEYYVAFAKHMASFSLVSIGTLAACKLISNINLVDLDDEYDIGGIAAFGTDIYGFGIAFLLFNFTLLFATSRYPLRIYKHKTSYVAIFEGNVPRTTTRFPFSQGEIQEVTGNILPWYESIYKIKTKSVLIFMNYFRSPAEFSVMFRTKSEKAK